MTQAFDDREPVAASQGLSAVRPARSADLGPADVEASDPGLRIVDRLDRSNPNASCQSARGVVVSGPAPTPTRTQTDRAVLI